MKIKGKVWKFGNNINTDEIVPAKYLNIFQPSQLAMHCMAGIRPGFAQKIAKGDIIVAARNFGCGSSREHAPLAIKASGISCVIALSFARIFFRNSINIGLPILECPEAGKIKEGDILEVHLQKGLIKNISADKIYRTSPFPLFMQKIIQAGGLLKYIKQKQND